MAEAEGVVPPEEGGSSQGVGVGGASTLAMILASVMAHMEVEAMGNHLATTFCCY